MKLGAPPKLVCHRIIKKMVCHSCLAIAGGCYNSSKSLEDPYLIPIFLIIVIVAVIGSELLKKSNRIRKFLFLSERKDFIN